jgi:glutamyl/glutaminyl-tRNA synthetase
LCVVVDDLRHGVDLGVRGEDLTDATPAQIRLARLLGRTVPSRFAHHPLIRRPDGSKLSKADGATSIRTLLDEGRSIAELVGEVTYRLRLQPTATPIPFDEAIALVA